MSAVLTRELLRRLEQRLKDDRLLNDPYGPSDVLQAHSVYLGQIVSPEDRNAMWDDPQQWCRFQASRRAGLVWSRRREMGGHVYYSFSDEKVGVEFALMFK